jgi:acetoin utilization protein AcuB
MAKNPIRVLVTTSVGDAIGIMRDNSIRHLPVVDAAGKLAGWATLSDLRQGLIPSMVADLSLKDLMIENPHTVSPGDDVEDAAQLIYQKKIGGMPVVDGDGALVGVITVTDILRAFIEMMGLLTQSWRLDVSVTGHADGFADASRIIQEHGGHILSVAMAAHRRDEEIVYFRMKGQEAPEIRRALEKAGYEIL